MKAVDLKVVNLAFIQAYQNDDFVKELHASVEVFEVMRADRHAITVPSWPTVLYHSVPLFCRENVPAWHVQIVHQSGEVITFKLGANAIAAD